MLLGYVQIPAIFSLVLISLCLEFRLEQIGSLFTVYGYVLLRRWDSWFGKRFL